jgi:hypothetical protein
VTRVRVDLEYSLAPSSAPPPAPSHGCDLHGVPTRIASCSLGLDEPIEIRLSAARARDIKESTRRLASES